jgi:hypothetical protein
MQCMIASNKVLLLLLATKEHPSGGTVFTMSCACVAAVADGELAVHASQEPPYTKKLPSTLAVLRSNV